MWNVYGLCIWSSCLGPILMFGVVFVLAHRKNWNSVFKRISLIVLLIFIWEVLSFFVVPTVAKELQALVSLPYIRDALDSQCKDTTIVVDASGFSVDFYFDWDSATDSTRCYFSNVEWRCDCNSQ